MSGPTGSSRAAALPDLPPTVHSRRCLPSWPSAAMRRRPNPEPLEFVKLHELLAEGETQPSRNSHGCCICYLGAQHDGLVRHCGGSPDKNGVDRLARVPVAPNSAAGRCSSPRSRFPPHGRVAACQVATVDVHSPHEHAVCFDRELTRPTRGNLGQVPCGVLARTPRPAQVPPYRFGRQQLDVSFSVPRDWRAKAIGPSAAAPLTGAGRARAGPCGSARGRCRRR